MGLLFMRLIAHHSAVCLDFIYYSGKTLSLAIAKAILLMVAGVGSHEQVELHRRRRVNRKT